MHGPHLRQEVSCPVKRVKTGFDEIECVFCVGVFSVLACMYVCVCACACMLIYLYADSA